MSAVQKARAFHMNNARESLGVLKYMDVKKTVRQRSLQTLEQITNMCERMKINEYWFQQQTIQNKVKFLQAYQYSICYSKNLKGVYDEKQREMEQANGKLAEQIDHKRKTIRDHKDKVQKRKAQYRIMKLTYVRKAHSDFEIKIQKLKHQQDELNEVRLKVERQIQEKKKQLNSQLSPQLVYYVPYPEQGRQNQNGGLQGYPQSYYYNSEINSGRTSNANHFPDMMQGDFPPNQNQYTNQYQYFRRQEQNYPPFNGGNPPSSYGNPLINSRNPSNNQNPNGIKEPFNVVKAMISSADFRNKLLDSNSYKQQHKNQSSNSISSNSNISCNPRQSKKQKSSQKMIHQFDSQNDKLNKKHNEINGSIQDLIQEHDRKQVYESPSIVLMKKTKEVDIILDYGQNLKSSITKRTALQRQSKKLEMNNGSKVSRGEDSSIMKASDSFFQTRIHLQSNIDPKKPYQVLAMKSGKRSPQSIKHQLAKDQLLLPDAVKVRRTQDQNSLQNESSSGRGRSSDPYYLRYEDVPQCDEGNLFQSSKGDNVERSRIFKNGLGSSRVQSGKERQSHDVKPCQDSNGGQKGGQLLSKQKENRGRQEQWDQIGDLDLKSKVYKNYAVSKQPKVTQSSFPNRSFIKQSQILSAVLQQQDSQTLLASKPTVSIITPPKIQVHSKDGEDEDEYGQDQWDQELVEESEPEVESIEANNTNRNQVKPSDKSSVNIVISPNDSYADLLKQPSLFTELANKRFQLKPEIANQLKNHSDNVLNSDLMQPLPAGVLKSRTDNLITAKLFQSTISIQVVKTQDNLEFQEQDFMDSIQMPMNSIIGKRSSNRLLKTSQLKSSSNSNQPRYSIRVFDNGGKNILNSQQLGNAQSTPKNSTSKDSLLLLPTLVQSIAPKMPTIAPNRPNNTLQLIESETFNQRTARGQSEENLDLLKIQGILKSLPQKQNKNQNSSTQNLTLIQISKQNVLKSKQMQRVQQHGQIRQQQQLDEQIQLQLQGNSKVNQQSTKQQLQRQIIKLIRNRGKNSHNNTQFNEVQKSIQSEIEREIQTCNQGKRQKRIDWEQVQMKFEARIQQLRKEYKINEKSIMSKLNQIQKTNSQNKVILKGRHQKDINRQTYENKQSQDNLQLSQLSYSQSLVKDLNTLSYIKKNNQTDKNTQSIQQNNLEINSLEQLSDQNWSLREKSVFGNEDIENKMSQNDSDEFGLLLQHTSYKPPLQKRQGKDGKLSNQLQPQNSPALVTRQNLHLNSNQTQRDVQPAKSKYATKLSVPKASSQSKGTPIQTMVSKLQQNKYLNIQDPLDNQLIQSKTFGNKYPNKKKPDGDDDF